MTDSTPDLCCTHGERIDRLVELMEEVHAARDGKPCGPCEERKREEDAATEKWKQEFMARHGLTEDGAAPKRATGGPVRGPGALIAGNGVDCVFPFTADVVRAANPSPAIDPQAVASEAIRVHLSPAESVIPGPNGPIHIRGAYGDQPAEVTEIDMDDLEDEGDNQ